MQARSSAQRASPLSCAFARVIDELPRPLRAAARGLPHRLGLTKDLGGGFDDYTQVEFLYDLPLVVARDVVLPGPVVVAYREAHFRAGFFGLAYDRICDGQVAVDDELRELTAQLGLAWERALARALPGGRRATGDAAALIRATLCECNRAFRAERKMIQRGTATVTEYVNGVLRKTRWLFVTTRVMLQHNGYATRIPSVSRVFEAVLLGMQLRDDAFDEAEDCDLHGSTFPQLLSVSSGAFFRAATSILDDAALWAFRAGLQEVGLSIGELRRFNLGSESQQDWRLDALGGLLILSEARDRWSPCERAPTGPSETCFGHSRDSASAPVLRGGTVPMRSLY